MNVYRYTWNNPVMWRDPSGMSVLLENASLNRTAVGMAAGAVGGGIIYTASDALRRMQSGSALEGTGGGIACAFFTISRALQIGGGSIGNCSIAEEPKRDAPESGGGADRNGANKGADAEPAPPPLTAKQKRKQRQERKQRTRRERSGRDQGEIDRGWYSNTVDSSKPHGRGPTRSSDRA